jgi:hypothetical protein
LGGFTVCDVFLSYQLHHVSRKLRCPRS